MGLGLGLGLGLGVWLGLDAARRLAADRELEEDARCAIEG